jgi:hypothetical protein
MLPKRKVAILSLALTRLMISPALCAAVDDAWQRLKQLRHDVGFVFVQRDQTCPYGQIETLTNKNISIRTDRSQVTIEKSSLIRVRLGFGGRSIVSNNPNLPLFTVYSGRSSWRDLLAFAPFQSKTRPGSTLQLSVTTKDGKSHRAYLSQVTDRDLALADAFGKETVFPKTEIARVDYIRDKPLSDTEEFHWEELAMFRIFDPQLYPRLFHIGNTMSVRLYDSAILEDDSAIECK